MGMHMQGRRQKRKPVAEMNVVPYIDVMLVLLVIFMVTAPMLNQGVKVDLPQVSSEVLPSDSNQQVLTLSVLADGTYYWNLGESVDTENHSDSVVSLAEMTEGVTKIMTAKPVTVAPDHTVSRALSTMLNRRISCLPVMDQARVCGIITTTDLLMALACLLEHVETQAEGEGAGRRARRGRGSGAPAEPME